MRSLRVSLLLTAGLVVLSLTARSLTTALISVAGPRFLPILCLALVGAILLLDLFRALRARSGAQLPAVVLAGATVLFILASRPLAHLQLLAAACFILGTSIRLESRRPDWPGLVLIGLAAMAVAGAVLLRSGGRFLPMEAWVYLLAGLSGYCAAAGWRR